MKNRFLQFFIAILVVLFFGCSTSSDGNGNSTTTVVPLPPTNLIGVVGSTTQINLSWTDNSTNETGFKIQRRTGSSIYTIVGTVNSDVLTFSDTGLTPGTTYIFRVYSYNSVGDSPTYSNEVTVTTTAIITLATLTTTAVSGITTTAAATGGTITSDGGAPITARGIVWSNLPNPTIDLPTQTSDGSGIGTFTSTISGLNPNWDYHVRAYATNSAGTAYGNEITFTTLQNSTAINVPGPNVTDIDGNVYQSVTNCNQTWTKSNLNVSKYSDGTPIPQVTDPTQWANLTTGAWCYYNNDSANGIIYGKLYNWYAVAGIYDAASASNPSLRKKLAPIGWHVPSDSEWTQLTDCLGGKSVAGGKMKSEGTTLWLAPNTLATNESGYTGLPAGYRNHYGTYNEIGNYGVWWSSTENAPYAWSRSLVSYDDSAFTSSNYKLDGKSVRCLKD